MLLKKACCCRWPSSGSVWLRAPTTMRMGRKRHGREARIADPSAMR
jgi:hypothetical protein